MMINTLADLINSVQVYSGYNTVEVVGLMAYDDLPEQYKEYIKQAHAKYRQIPRTITHDGFNYDENRIYVIPINKEKKE